MANANNNQQVTRSQIGFEISHLDLSNVYTDITGPTSAYRTEKYILIYITAGRGLYEIDDVVFHVNPNDLLVISRNRRFRLLNSHGLKGYLIHITEGYLCELLSDERAGVKALFHKSFLRPHETAFDLYADLMHESLNYIMSLYQFRESISDKYLLSIAFKSFAKLVENIIDETTSEHVKHEVFVSFTELIQRHISHSKSVTEYANMLHVSKKTLNTLTRQAVDMSAKQYINQQLLLLIKRKLTYERKSIHMLSEALGFSEPSNMTRFFKHHTGKTPKDFVKQVHTKYSPWTISKKENLDQYKDSVEKNIYEIASDILVPLHKHESHTEIFYCIMGSGFIVLEDSERLFNLGDVYVATPGTMHSIRTDEKLYVISLLIPDLR